MTYREFMKAYGPIDLSPDPEIRHPGYAISRPSYRFAHDEQRGTWNVPRPLINIKCDMESLTYCSLCVNLAQYCRCREQGTDEAYQRRLRPVLLRRRVL